MTRKHASLVEMMLLRRSLVVVSCTCFCAYVSGVINVVPSYCKLDSLCVFFIRLVCCNDMKVLGLHPSGMSVFYEEHCVGSLDLHVFVALCKSANLICCFDDPFCTLRTCLEVLVLGWEAHVRVDCRETVVSIGVIVF